MGRGRGRDLTVAEMDTLRGLRACTGFKAIIAQIIGRSEKAVRNFLKKEDSISGYQSTRLTCAKRKTTAQDDLRIMMCFKRNRFITANDIRLETGLDHVSLQTIKSRVKESGKFNSYMAARKPFITNKSKMNRLKWAREHVQWHRVMWPDESPFVFRFDGKMRVWRLQNERYENHCMRGWSCEA